MEGTETQLRKQKRIRIMSNKAKFHKRNGNKHLQCVLTPTEKNNNNEIPCFINKKSVSSCGFCASYQSGDNISNCNKRSQYRRYCCEYIVCKNDKCNIHLIN